METLPLSSCPPFTLFASSYEGKLIGVSFLPDSQGSLILSSKVSESSLRAVSLHGTSLLACGGAEEVVKLIDLTSNVEKAMLVHHKGSITSILEVDSHFLVGSADGEVSIWRLVGHEWVMVRTLTIAKYEYLT